LMQPCQQLLGFLFSKAFHFTCHEILLFTAQLPFEICIPSGCIGANCGALGCCSSSSFIFYTLCNIVSKACFTSVY
jgi:hypothetical protein